MFVGVVVENFHRCRAEQEKEERARRAAKRAKKIEERRRSKSLQYSIHYVIVVVHLFKKNVSVLYPYFLFLNFDLMLYYTYLLNKHISSYRVKLY